jgi:hypothetical protein
MFGTKTPSMMSIPIGFTVVDHFDVALQIKIGSKHDGAISVFFM